MAILDVQHIEKSFGSTKVLRDINFSLAEGQVLAIIGSSGSGKTTPAAVPELLETPDKGTISVRDEVLFDAADPATQREGGDPPQAPALRPGVPELQPLPPVHRPGKRHPWPGS